MSINRAPLRIRHLLGVVSMVGLLLGCSPQLDEDVLLERAQMALAEGDYQAATLDAKTVLQGDASNLAARRLLGLIYLRQQDTPAAILALIALIAFLVAILLQFSELSYYKDAFPVPAGALRAGDTHRLVLRSEGWGKRYYGKYGRRVLSARLVSDDKEA